MTGYFYSLFLKSSFNNREHYSLHETIGRVTSANGSSIKKYRKYRIGEQVQRRNQAHQTRHYLCCQFVPLNCEFVAVFFLIGDTTQSFI